MRYSAFGVIVIGVIVAAYPARASDLSIKPGDQVVRVDVKTEDQLKVLLSSDLDLDIWSHEYGVGPMDVHASIEQRKKLDAAGLTYKVLNPDLVASTAREQAEIAVRSPGDFTAYKDLNGIIAYINGLAAARPDLCSVSTFGLSLEGRPMYVLKITGPNPGPKPAVFYHGLIHAREWIAGSVAMYLAEHIVNNYDTDPCLQALVNATEIYIAPCVNPDGYNYTWTTQRLWRKNRRPNAGGSFGVDNNRNFGYQWGSIPGGGSSGTPTDDTYRGTAAFSEPETQNIRDFILNHPNIKAYMDYHSYSQLLMWAWGYTPSLSPDDAKFRAVGNFMQQLITNVNAVTYVPGPINTTIYQANGTSVDWAYGSAARFAYTIELRDTGAFGFQLPASQILPTCLENLQGILYLTRWASSGILLDVSNPPTQLLSGQSTQISVNINNAQENYVGGSGQLYYRVGTSGPFTSVPLVLQGGTNYTGTIPSQACGQTIQYYVAASGSGGSTAVQPCGAPTTLYSAPVVYIQPPQIIYSVPLDSNPGWTLGSGWAFGQPAGQCGDPSSGYTGTNVYGYNLSGCYANNVASTLYLTTTPFDCTNVARTQLRFRRWLGVEESIYDHANIQVSNDNTNWTTVWSNVATLSETSWSLQTIDISSVADGRPAVRVRWGMGSTDGGLFFCGWNIDDVEIVQAPLPNCNGILRGDVNHDGIINALDIAAFTRILVNPSVATSADICAADMNQTCGVTIEDVEPFVDCFLSCGCNVPPIDSDGDGVADCIDGCPNDPNKTAHGVCGCGVSDVDTDGDGTPDCNDGCPNDPNKVAPGFCGCSVPDTDTDGDGVPDCHDLCPGTPPGTPVDSNGCPL